MRKVGKRKKGIIGCHDKTAFYDQNVIRSIDASMNPNYVTNIGKKLDEVEEIVIVSKTPHTNVPGVEIVEYKIPSLSNTNPPLTTGQLSVPSNGGVKTLYSPEIWTDIKLKKAVKEAMKDAHKNLDELIEGKFIGVTKEGYKIEGYIKNGVLDTFYFL